MFKMILFIQILDVRIWSREVCIYSQHTLIRTPVIRTLANSNNILIPFDKKLL